jgi:alkyl hydroperoxide reductase subunit AhpF
MPRVVGGILKVGVRAKRVWGREAVILSMGLVWREVNILAEKTTTPSKGLFCLESLHIC